MISTNQFYESGIIITKENAISFNEMQLALNRNSDESYQWSRLYSESTRSPLYSEVLGLSNDEWAISGCYVCEGNASTYFTEADL